MRKGFGIVIVSLMVLALAPAGVWGYAGPLAPWPAWYPPGVINPGTVNTAGMTFGTVINYNPATMGTGNSGALVGWDDTWVPVTQFGAATAGDNLDGDWIQTTTVGPGGVGGPTGIIWDFGAGQAFNQVYVFGSQDHGPYLGEGMEMLVQGTNNLAGPWSAAINPAAVWMDGWRPHDNPANLNDWRGDDITVLFNMGQAYRYVMITALQNGFDPEIDAIGAVPLPPTVWLLGSALLGLAGWRRFRKG